jgi:hypothetical protein
LEARIAITVAALKAAVQEDTDQLMTEVTAAMNAAPGGRVIAASEGPIREAVARFRQKVQQTATQLATEAAEAAFFPGGPDDGRSPR